MPKNAKNNKQNTTVKADGVGIRDRYAADRRSVNANNDTESLIREGRTPGARRFRFRFLNWLFGRDNNSSNNRVQDQENDNRFEELPILKDEDEESGAGDVGSINDESDDSASPIPSADNSNIIILDNIDEEAVQQEEQEKAKEREEEDLWAEAKDIEGVVVEPIENGIVEQVAFESSEAVTIRPVFESHAYWVGTSALHSYMGLRYTIFNEKSGKYERKRSKIGFGAKGGMITTGDIKNEKGTTSDASSQTPIEPEKFNAVDRAIENTQANISEVKKMGFFRRLFGNGNVNNTEFSGKYNFFTNNCNDFVVRMAEVAGLDTVADLHRSMWGPIAARANLALAASEKLNGQTRIYNGGRIIPVKKRILLTQFLELASKKSYANFLGSSSQESDDSALNTVLQEINRNLAALEVGDDRYETVRVKNGYENGREIVSQLKQQIRTAIGLNKGGKQFSTNMQLLRLEQLVDEAEVNLGGQIKPERAPNEREIEFEAGRRTDSEKKYVERAGGAEKVGKIVDKELFRSTNLDKSIERVGLVLLSLSGVRHLVNLGRIMQSEDTPKQMKDKMREVLSALRGSEKELKPFIELFMEKRPYLNEEQVYKLLVLAIHRSMGNLNMLTAKGKQYREEAENDQASEEAKAMLLNLNKRRNLAVYGDDLIEQFKINDEIERVLYAYVRNIKSEKTTTNEAVIA